MVSREGGYYRTAFQGAHEVTQGYPLSPTILNMVIDAVVRHRVMVMVEGAEERASVDRRVGTRLSSSTRTIAWLNHQTPTGSRVHLIPWSDYLIGWACGLMWGSQSEGSTAPSRRQRISQRKRMGDG